MGNYSVIQGGKLLSCATKNSPVPSAQAFHWLAWATKYISQAISAKVATSTLHTKKWLVCPESHFAFLRYILWSCNPHWLCLIPSSVSAPSLQPLQVSLAGYNCTMLSLCVRSPALTKHCPFAQGFCSWQISLRGEHPFGPYPLPVKPDVQEQNAMGPWEIRHNSVTMTTPMSVNVLDILKENLNIIPTYLIFWHLPWSVPSLNTKRALVFCCYGQRVQGHLHGKWWGSQRVFMGRGLLKAAV